MELQNIKQIINKIMIKFKILKQQYHGISKKQVINDLSITNYFFSLILNLDI